ncbi:TetR/AcrR family transcriptional regulator [Kordiimonas gwangyangensis]|uniref:TetR/AcrR family transcriptional regulator n=1 Tax=Kordiimonas gwangyangensis TaxID=288022 RepID=UPI00037B9434|nr:TetR/AcrR family transcriptional regulator [Kordiimonas gwangyangensis]
MAQIKKKRQGRPPTVENARARIVDEASALFASRGVETSTLAEVAEAIGVSKAGVYHYFKSKQDIYDEIIVRALMGLTSTVREALSDVEGDAERLRTFMLAHARFFEKNHSDFVTMLIGFGGMSNAAHKDEALILRDRYEAILRNILVEGARNGSFRNVDISTSSRAILSMLNWMVRWFRPGGSKSAEAFAAEYFDFIALGLVENS